MTIPRAVRPVNARVSAVGPASASASLWTATVAASGAAHERGAELRRDRAGGDGGDARRWRPPVAMIGSGRPPGRRRAEVVVAHAGGGRAAVGGEARR